MRATNRITDMSGSHCSLKWILFENEQLPEWAELLDLAAMISPNSSETRGWFSRFTSTSGVDDARSVVENCESLRASLQAHGQEVMTEFSSGPADSDASAVLAAWIYTLDTMIHKASSLKTCSWLVEGSGDMPSRLGEGGDLKLHRA